jgi:hypothetical protein
MNPELLFNQYITPVYITTTNMVTPIANINFGYLYTNVVEFATTIWQICVVVVCTFVFIAKEACVAINDNLTTTEKILTTLCLYNFITYLISYSSSNDKQSKVQETFNSIEKQLDYLKTSDKMRDNWEHLWLQEIRNMHNENNTKFKDIETVLNSQKRVVDAQTKNEKEILKSVTELSKEIKRIKNELNKYL